MKQKPKIINLESGDYDSRLIDMMEPEYQAKVAYAQYKEKERLRMKGIAALFEAAVRVGLGIFFLAFLMFILIVSTQAADYEPTLPYSVEQCEFADFGALAVADVTDQWWIDLREYPHTERSQIAYEHFRGYRYIEFPFYYRGVAFAISKPAPSVDDRFDSYVLYAGWYWGNDGNPHPSCGVYMIDKAIVDQLTY